MRLKNFEAFGYVPDKKRIEEEMAKRVSQDTAPDKAGIFTNVEKDFLLEIGFEIRRNDKKLEDLAKGKPVSKTIFVRDYLEVSEIAETYDNMNNKIIIFKHAPKEIEYTYIKYYFVIIKNDKIVSSKYETTCGDYIKFGKDSINESKIECLKKLLDLVYFELMDWEEEERKINKIKEERKKIDPFDEEDWGDAI